MKVCVYGGSFDPPTNGHLWVAKQGIELYDKLYWVIGINPDKKCDFTLVERIEMIIELTKEFDNVKVGSFENKYLVNHVESVRANYILRGLRTDEDYEYERKMWHMNYRINPKIMTFFVMPPKDLEDLSSSFVKGLVGPHGWEEVVKELVPLPVFKKMLEKYKDKRTNRKL